MLLLSQAVPRAAASSPIFRENLTQGWQDGSITETVLGLNGHGIVSEKASNGGAASASRGICLTLNGGHHTIYCRQAEHPYLYQQGV